MTLLLTSILVFSSMFLFIGCNNLTTTQTNGINHSPINILQKNTMRINNTLLTVEIANTHEQRTTGLSDRNKLDANEGMLFDFTNTTNKRPGFWMKDTKFSLDIIWIKDGQIIDITPNIPVPNNQDPLPVYYPPREIDYVLEVNGNWTKINQINTGDKINF